MSLDIDVPVSVKHEVDHLSRMGGGVGAGPVEHAAVEDDHRAGLDVLLNAGILLGLPVGQPAIDIMVCGNQA